MFTENMFLLFLRVANDNKKRKSHALVFGEDVFCLSLLSFHQKDVTITDVLNSEIHKRIF